jgi:hypothetical protein
MPLIVHSSGVGTLAIFRENPGFTAGRRIFLYCREASGTTSDPTGFASFQRWAFLPTQTRSLESATPVHIIAACHLFGALSLSRMIATTNASVGKALFIERTISD